ncbi:MAG: polysaccharide biosynthesis C-terminal domain-containing protein [Candidatus Dormibacteraeota bacterium]|nr:polysaccharide biosynthesis C-terminal domain-containing protein [Candidatus Dormibacteraeota bacterium]
MSRGPGDPAATAGHHSDRAVIRQSGLTGVAAAVSVGVGLLLDITIAARFGAGRNTDAFFVAARIPLGLVAVVLVVANQALVAAFRTSLTGNGDAATGRLVSRIVGIVIVAGVAFVLVASLLATPLIRITAPGISSSEVATAATMVPIVFAMVPLVAVSEVMRAFCNARYAFIVPALMNVVLSGVAATVILVGPRHAITVVAWGYLAGAVGQVSFMTTMAVRRGLRLRPVLDLKNQELRAIGKLSVRPFFAAGCNPLARLGEQLMVSFLPVGSITILNYGYRLISAVGGTIFFRSVVVALVPRLTEAHIRGDNRETLRITGLGLRIMLALSVPLTVFMAVLAEPAALTVFQRGNFTRASASLLGVVLAVYSISLVGSALQRVLLAPFFARLDTRTPLRNTVYGVLANLALLPLLTLPFGWGNRNAIIGIALAYSLAQFVNVTHAWYCLRRAIGSPARGLARLAPRLVAASVISGAAMVGAVLLFQLDDSLSTGTLFLRTAVTGLGGVAILALAMLLFAGKDLSTTWRSLRRRPATPALQADAERLS